MESTEILLLGAPDVTIGTPEAKSNGQRAMRIDLTQEVLDELIQSVASGSAPQIAFGRIPQLRFGGQSHALIHEQEKHRFELYSSENDENLSFSGLVSHTLTLEDALKKSGQGGSEANLKHNMAAKQEERDALKVTRDTTPLQNQSQHRRNLSKRGNFLNPSSLMGTPGSNPSSPALGTQSSPRVAPTSAPVQANAAKLKAIRRPMLHLLAIKPRSPNELTKMLRCKSDESKSILIKIATLDSASAKYKLSDRYYKELDVFEFPYKTTEEREAAIENAIKAYDRTRLSKDDKLWQKLLPKAERGQGICLSKLVIAPPTQVTKTTPKLPKKVEKKEGAPKKTETKKTAGEEVPKKALKPAKPARPAEKEPVRKNKIEPQDSTTRKKKAPKSAAVVPKEDRANEDPSVLKTRQTKPAKKATAQPARTLANKPKNPSPLSASPPVNASDFEDSHPVHKALAASASPAKTASQSSTSASNSDRSLKRKANDLDNNIHTHAVPKQRKLKPESQTQTRTPVNGFKPGSHNSTPSLSTSSSSNRKVSTLDSASPSSSAHTPTKRPRLTNTSQPLDTHTSSLSDSPDSSPTSPVLLSYRQTIDLSQRFHAYYEKYHRLHTQLSTAPDPPTPSQRKELLKMHSALEKMKETIRVGAAKNRSHA